MNVDDVVKSVQRQFGDETGAQIEASDVIRWINDGQLRIFRKTEAGSTTYTTVVPLGSEGFALPADFFKVEQLTLTGSSGVPKHLTPVGMGQLRTMYPTVKTDASGVSKLCSFQRINGVWYVWFAPKPSETVTMFVAYKNRPPIIDASTDPLYIPEEFHDDLVTFCLAMAKQLDGDMDAYNSLMVSFNGTITDEAHDERHKDAETYPFIRVSDAD